LALNINIVHTVTPSTDCIHLQSHIDSIHDWCVAHHMKLNTGKIRVITFARKLMQVITLQTLF
jgi:hypothetical protein